VRVGRRDEIDLILRQKDVLVFTEVKTRKHEAYGRPAAAVDRKKRAALSRAAVRYVKRLRKPPRYIRFDVVEVIGAPDAGPPVIHHIEAAFPLDRRYDWPL